MYRYNQYIRRLYRNFRATAILWALLLTVGSFTSQTIYAQSCTIDGFASNASFMFQDTSGQRVTTAYQGGVFFIKDKTRVRTQFTVDVTPNSIPGTPEPLTAQLKVNGSDVNVSTNSSYWDDIGEYARFTSDFSDYFDLNNGNNTIGFGGWLQFLASGNPVACTEEYQYVTVRPDLQSPTTDILSAQGTECPLTNLQNNNCYVSITYKGSDPDSPIKDAYFTFSVSGGISGVQYPLDANKFNGTDQIEMVPYSTFGINQPGTYSINVQLVASDVVGHTDTTTAGINITVIDDTQNNTTSTPTPTPSQNQGGTNTPTPAPTQSGNSSSGNQGNTNNTSNSSQGQITPPNTPTNTPTDSQQAPQVTTDNPQTANTQQTYTNKQQKMPGTTQSTTKQYTNIPIMFVGILILIGAAGAGYWYYSQNKNNKNKDNKGQKEDKSNK